jgi:hypothetical protein
MVEAAEVWLGVIALNLATNGTHSDVAVRGWHSLTMLILSRS